MKTGEVAKLLNVDRKTIRNWIDDYGLEELFSPGARGIDGNIQRNLTEADALALNTIRVLRAKGVNDWNKIKEHLERGEWETEFPTNATSADRRMIPVEQLQQSGRVVETVRERDVALVQRDAALAQVEQLEAEIQRVRESEAAKQKRIEELIRDSADTERLRAELAAERKDKEALLRETALWQARYEILKESLEAKEKPR